MTTTSLFIIILGTILLAWLLTAWWIAETREADEWHRARDDAARRHPSKPEAPCPCGEAVIPAGMWETRQHFDGWSAVWVHSRSRCEPVEVAPSGPIPGGDA